MSDTGQHSEADIVSALRAAFDPVLARGGFTFNQSGESASGAGFELLYEATPAEATALVPHVAPYLGDLGGWCLDLTMTYDAAHHALRDVTVEAVPLPVLLRETGHPSEAAAVESAAGFDGQVGAYAAAFAALFATPPELR